MEEYLPEYPPLEEEDFFTRIVSKREFFDHESSIFAAHQMNVARYMSQWTLYNSLLLFHEMGTGKSGLTVALLELIREQGERGRILYITHNQTQIDNYKNEVHKFSTRLRSRLERDNIQDPARRERRWSSILHEDGFEFYTMGALSGLSRRLLDQEGLRARYEGCIVILDEAHHLVQSQEQQDKKSYDIILRFLSSLSSRKLLVMTGTPIRDQPGEIVPLLNLVLPAPQRFDRGQFLTEFFEVERWIEVLDQRRLPLYRWRPGAERRFRDRLRGRISYLRREMSSVTVRYMGDIYAPMQSMRLVMHIMNPLEMQNLVYQEVFSKEAGLAAAANVQDEIEIDAEAEADAEDLIMVPKTAARRVSAAYGESSQASLFVFPDETWGKKGFKTYVKNHRMSPVFFEQTRLRLTALPSDEEILSVLSQFSIMYADVIREIRAHPKELIYVFSDLVRGSGILLFMAILRSLFGFELVASPADMDFTPGNRLILLNDEVSREEDFQQLLAYFNDPRNREAQLCQILLSTGKTKEGISLRNIRQIHILTPSWNMGDTSQAMARSLRARSHEDLIDPTVRIFLHCVAPYVLTPEEEEQEDLGASDRPPTEQELMRSIDFQKHYRSEIKERNTKLIERVFLESSWDCTMNLPINSKTGRIQDGSRECEYDRCEYECEGVEKGHRVGTDVANDNLFYSTVVRDRILQLLRDLFQTRSAMSLGEILNGVQSALDTEWDRHILIEECLWDALQQPLVFMDYRNMPRFLANAADMFFLVDNPMLPLARSPEMAVFPYYYQQRPATRIEFTLGAIMDGYYLQNIRILLPRLLRLIRTQNGNARPFLQAFPLEFQRLFCEIAIEQELLPSQPLAAMPSLITWFIKEFRTEITHTPGLFIDHRFVMDRRRPRRLNLQSPGEGWRTVEP